MTTSFEAATRPTLRFIGVSTGQSSIMTVFPRWAEILGLGDCAIAGMDLPLHAPMEAYRRAVTFVRDDPLSRGALVTSHKIDLFRTCRDLFGRIDEHAGRMREAGCLSKRDGVLVCHAKDPIAAGLALGTILDPDHWTRHGDTAFVMGAGGAGRAIVWCLANPPDGMTGPRRIVVSDVDPGRLADLADTVGPSRPGIVIDPVGVRVPEDNDQLLSIVGPGALVVNATGLGKDRPGSPITDDAVFPDRAVVWELNYRGSLDFLHQAEAAAARYGLRTADGWVYFLHGWTQVVAEVFDIAIPPHGPTFDTLARIAAEYRYPRPET